MRSSQSNTPSSTMQEAMTYLNRIVSDVNINPDFARLHGYLKDLAPQLQKDVVSADLIRTVARLYFESMRYAESAEVLQHLEDPLFNEMRVNNDFYNGYYTTFHCWEARQEDIWKAFKAMEKAFKADNENLSKDVVTFRKSIDPYFPSSFLLVRPPKDKKKGALVLGNPNGIFSLVPLLYLIRHAPSSLSKRWSVLLAEPCTSGRVFRINGQTVSTKDIRVQVSPGAVYSAVSKVRLTVWHPFLAELAGQGSADYAAQLAAQMVNDILPLSAMALSVEQIALTERPLSEADSMPLPDLKDWFQEKGLFLDVPPEQILEHRRLSFTRTPAPVSRPRADILRGETCMPELEEIYFLRDSKGMAAIQRYGMGYWFLTIPKKVCGDNFDDFRTKLEAHVHREQGDKVCFTGWAEGVQNCYIDFLVMDGKSALNTMNRYFQKLRRGKDIRLCSFYWNSVLRTADLFKEMSDFQRIEMQLAMHPYSNKPPKELTSPKEQAAMEKAFRETQWSQSAAPAQDAKKSEGPQNVSDYNHALKMLEETAAYTDAAKEEDSRLDYARIHDCLRIALPADPDADIGTEYRHQLTLVLASAGRYRESVRWASLLSPEQRYICDIGSSYLHFNNQWETRRQALWVHFATVESELAKQLSGSGNSDVENDFRLWADSIFPDQELTLLPGQKKNTLLTGLPDGILTLPAMLYLTSHVPSSLERQWNIAISDASLPDFVPVGRFTVPAREIKVSLTQKDSKVSLVLWHPKLVKTAEGDIQPARHCAARLVNCALPMGARLLYVEDIDAAEEAPEQSFPLPELQQQMGALGFPTEIALDTLLSRRRYTMTRQPKNTGRPRDDILRGETCMPELEHIYNRLYEEGQIILERYGLNAVFLMIPKSVCGEDPMAYAQHVQRLLSLAEGDKVFFTGWAEGTRYMYLDLITMHGKSLQSALDTYARSSPDGSQFQFSAFYWDSKPYFWLVDAAYDQMAPPDLENVDIPSFLQGKKSPNFPVPDAATASAFEASFHPAFRPEDFCTPKPAEAPASTARQPVFGKKKLSKAQRKALNSKNAQNNQNNKGGKNSKKKR